MIKPNQLPIEVMNEFHAALLHGESYVEAFAAALNAWPGVTTTSWFENGVRKAVLNIPLPQENANAEG